MEKLTVNAVREMLACEGSLEDATDNPGSEMEGQAPEANTDVNEEAAQNGGGFKDELGSELENAAEDGFDEEARSYVEGKVGLGVDIVEVERMAAILEKSKSFAERVFSPNECEYCNAKSRPAVHYALRFAAKEAVVKALGTGFADGIDVRDIEVEKNAAGKPLVNLTGKALEIAEEQGVRELSLSLSYTHTDAVACAMAVTAEAVRATEKRRDPAEELARQFKEIRGMLDEL